MRMIAAALLGLATIACATTLSDVEPGQAGDGSGSCSAQRPSGLVGRAATQALGAEALRLSNARALRWIRPGDAVTMDYRPDRLNIHLDAQGRVDRFACG